MLRCWTLTSTQLVGPILIDSLVRPCLSYAILGHGSDTKFDVNVRQREQLIRKVMVTYLGTASEFTGKYLPESILYY
jgi:hypothetical protein